MRVVIADDNQKMCMGIQKVIKDKFPQFIIEGVFEDGESLIELDLFLTVLNDFLIVSSSLDFIQTTIFN